ncbi:ATP-binding cassette domain-containing protein [bacterium]|nr:ATP-binding cassette domain-containing protein [bacterium]
MSPNKPGSQELVAVRDLKVHFPVHQGAVFRKKIGDVKAVDGVSFHIDTGETLGLVGESGSGKTTTGQAIMLLEPATGGKIFFEAREITGLDGKKARLLRRRMQLIYQDPFSSLNPRMKIGRIISEPLVIHGMVNGEKDRQAQVDELLETVGLSPAMAKRYPHEFSGGQRQRIGIARALSLKPGFIVCDEPVSALDVSIQAQIINLIEEIQEKFNLTYLFIAHDLALVRYISNRIAVMYLGKIVEIADRLELYRHPLHPYTQALLSAIPIPNPILEAQRKHIQLHGEIPSPLNPPSGCLFHPRCRHAKKECAHLQPQMREIAPDHFVSCTLFDS